MLSVPTCGNGHISWASNGPMPHWDRPSDITSHLHVEASQTRALTDTCRCAPQRNRPPICLPTRKHLHNMAALTSRRTHDDGISRQQLNDYESDVVITQWAAMKGNDGRSNNQRACVHDRGRNSRKKLCVRTKIGNSFCAIDILRKCV